MAKTTNNAFDEFDENLKLDPDERTEAQDAHNEITAVLIDKRLIVAAFLQGSFARKTMLAPLRDVDKIVVLHGDLDGLTPDEVMDRIEAAIRISHPQVTFDRTRHSLKLDFGEDSFYFDTVPGWESDTDDDDVLIANRDTGDWDRSNTRELIRVVAERNQSTDGLWIHQVRMAKQVVKNLLDGLIPGLHVESWAYIAVTEELDHDEALARILEHGADLLDRSYTEPTGVDKIADRLEPEVITSAKPALEDAARRAREARDLTEAGDDTEAIRIWHELCGECFPAPDPQDAATALSRAFQGGSVTSSGTVARSRAGAQPARPVRSWRSA